MWGKWKVGKWGERCRQAKPWKRKQSCQTTKLDADNNEVYLVGDSVVSDSLWTKGENKKVVGEEEKKWMKVNLKKGKSSSERQAAKQPRHQQISLWRERLSQVQKHLQRRERSSWTASYQPYKAVELFIGLSWRKTLLRDASWVCQS